MNKTNQENQGVEYSDGTEFTNTRPPVIVIEGIDGSGKTSLSHALAIKLKAYWSCEPFDAHYRTQIRDTTDESEKAVLFAADRYRHCQYLDLVLDSGPCVIDRYHYSNIVYQHILGGIPKRWLWNIQPLNLVKPSIIIHVTCDPVTAQKRCNKRHEIWAVDTLRKLQNEYVDLFASYHIPYITIDSTHTSKNDLLQTCITELKARLPGLTIYD